jgi:hypothetical protein
MISIAKIINGVFNDQMEEESGKGGESHLPRNEDPGRLGFRRLLQISGGLIRLD